VRARRLALFLAATAALALPGAAWAQLPELPGVPEVPELPDAPNVPEVPEAPETPTLPGILPSTTSPPPSPPAGDEESGSGDSAATGSTGSRSGSSSSQAATSSRNAGPRARFDRLPRRYEVLLERILRSDHVRANLRRLEQALTAASPELRARILRLVRREIASLERGRPTREDPRRLERLRRVEELLERRQGWPAGVEAGPGGSGAVAASAGGGATRAHDPAAAAPGKQTTGVSSAPKTIRPEMREAKGPRCVPHPLRGPGGHFRARM
jgi:hypothetical protein